VAISSAPLLKKENPPDLIPWCKSRTQLSAETPRFVGNARGGRAAAILASLTSTCRRHDVDPQLYLTQLLMNLPMARMSELSTWLPDRWKLAQTARQAGLQIHRGPVRSICGARNTRAETDGEA